MTHNLLEPVLGRSLSEREAFESGSEAQVKGYPASANPYPPGSEGRKSFEWTRGYKLAKRAILHPEDALFSSQEVRWFCEGYVNTAIWSTTNPDTELPLEETFHPRDIESDSIQLMLIDCRDFLIKHANNIRAYTTNSAIIDLARRCNTNCFRAAGGDFWLTRNRHSAGFVARASDIDELAYLLAEASQEYREQDLFPSADETLYIN